MFWGIHDVLYDVVVKPVKHVIIKQNFSFTDVVTYKFCDRNVLK